MSTLHNVESRLASELPPEAPAEFVQRDAPSISTAAIPQCPVCGESRYQTVAEGYDYELLTCRNRWRFVQCDLCAHVWLNPRPAVSELSVIYPRNYYAYNYGKIHPLARRAKEILDLRKIRGILSNHARPPRTYLDVGCGDGRFLRALERLGVPRTGLYGLELDQEVVDHLRHEGYSKVYCERVETTQQIPGHGIDLVTMFHVIEHVDDPGAVIRQIGSWLAPGGVLALETPNLDSLDARWFKKTYWGGYHIPRHWNLFTPATIGRLLEASGLEVIGTQFQTGHSFWMYSLHHLVRYGGASRPRAGQWFDPMKSLFGIAGFTAFGILRGALGAKTSAMLVLARKPSQ